MYIKSFLIKAPEETGKNTQKSLAEKLLAIAITTLCTLISLASNNVISPTTNALNISVPNTLTNLTLRINGIIPGILLMSVYALFPILLIMSRCGMIVPINNSRFASLNPSILKGHLRNRAHYVQVPKHI